MSKKGKILLSVIVAISILILVTLGGLGIYVYVQHNGFNIKIAEWHIHYPSLEEREAATTDESEKEIEYTARITYEMPTDSVTDEDADTVISVIRNRLDALGQAEASVERKGKKKIVVKLTESDGLKDLSNSLIETAVLTLQDPEGNIVLEGADIANATAMYGSLTESGESQHYVQLSLKNSGIEKFAAATAAAAARTDGSNYLAIMLNEEVISMPAVNQEINSSSVVISGGFGDSEDCLELANLINAGRLPFKLTVTEAKKLRTKN